MKELGSAVLMYTPPMQKNWSALMFMHHSSALMSTNTELDISQLEGWSDNGWFARHGQTPKGNRIKITSIRKWETLNLSMPVRLALNHIVHSLHALGGCDLLDNSAQSYWTECNRLWEIYVQFTWFNPLQPQGQSED